MSESDSQHSNNASITESQMERLHGFRLVRYVPERLDGDSDPQEEWEESSLPDVELPNHQARCHMCLEDFEPPRTKSAETGAMQKGKRTPNLLRELPCSHVFHKACIDPWLTRNSICALCRQNVFSQRDGTRPRRNGSRRLPNMTRADSEEEYQDGLYDRPARRRGPIAWLKRIFTRIFTRRRRRYR